jgi:hypothetical protein
VEATLADGWKRRSGFRYISWIRLASALADLAGIAYPQRCGCLNEMD